MRDQDSFTDLTTKLKNPENFLTEAQKRQLRSLGGNVENVVKASLINLLMGQFSKISVYEGAISETIKKLSERSNLMDTDELISFLGVLTKVNAVEVKTILDMFKKNDSDVKIFIKEVQKIVKERPDSEDAVESEIEKETTRSIKLSMEKKEKVLRILDKLRKDPE